MSLFGVNLTLALCAGLNSTGKSNGLLAWLKRMDVMSEKPKGEAEPPVETADAAELEASVSDIIGEVVLSGEGEAPGAEPGPAASVKETVEEVDSSESVLSQEISAPSEKEEAKEEGGDGDLSPEIQRAIDKRIAKAVAKQKSAEERASEAETKAEELSSELEDIKDQPMLGETSGTKSGPVGRAKTLPDLQKEEKRAEQVLDWSDDMLMQLKAEPETVEAELKRQKVDLRDTYGEEDYSPERMDMFLSELRRNTDRTLRRQVPERREYLELKEASDAQAKDLMPWLDDENSRQYKDVQDVMNTLPEITKLPHHKTAAGVFALGLEQLRQIEAEQKSGRARDTQPPSAQPGAPAAAPAVEPNAQSDNGADALKSWRESGESEDFDKYIDTLV